MKHLATDAQNCAPEAFSALGRAVWDETLLQRGQQRIPLQLSVLSVEPYGMKRLHPRPAVHPGPVFQCSRSSRMG